MECDGSIQQCENVRKALDAAHAQIAVLNARVAALEGQIVQACAALDAVENALDGEPESDFMLSFPVVRRVADLVSDKAACAKREE